MKVNIISDLSHQPLMPEDDGANITANTILRVVKL